MLVLSPGPGGDPAGSAVLVFGVGMIGSSISQSLLRLGYEVRAHIPYHWNDAAQRSGAQQSIAACCRDAASAERGLAIAWSAGDSAFHSTAEQAQHELEVFNETIGFIKGLREDLNLCRFAFHFISSAGGLFEGQRVVGMDSRPAPQRPYGQLKLSQETALLAHFGDGECAFYRASSVYGPMRQHARKGLINNLVNNGRNARTTVLDAHVMTLRDYVFSHDVGQFVARCIRSGSTGEGKRPDRFLVTSRCSSILEVVRKIERILNLHLRVRYDENFGNSRNITFTDRVMPAGWRPVTLDVGLRQFLVGAS